MPSAPPPSSHRRRDFDSDYDPICDAQGAEGQDLGTGDVDGQGDVEDQGLGTGDADGQDFGAGGEDFVTEDADGWDAIRGLSPSRDDRPSAAPQADAQGVGLQHAAPASATAAPWASPVGSGRGAQLGVAVATQLAPTPAVATATAAAGPSAGAEVSADRPVWGAQALATGAIDPGNPWLYESDPGRSACAADAEPVGAVRPLAHVTDLAGSARGAGAIPTGSNQPFFSSALLGRPDTRSCGFGGSACAPGVELIAPDVSGARLRTM